MATTQFLTHISLNGGHLIEAGFEPLAVAPSSPFQGQIYFNTVSDRLLYWDGTAWVDPASVSAAITAIDTTTTGVTVDDTDKSAVTVEVDSASATGPGLQSIVQFDLVAGATDANTASTLVKRDAAGNIKVGAPVNNDDAASKSYVDTLVSSGMTLKGATDCSANPNYPAAIIGDTYNVSVAGKIGGAAGDSVEVGDVYICVDDSAAGDQATVGSKWITVQRNDYAATTTASGNVRLANAGEVTAGTATDVAVTPADVTSMVGSAGASYTTTMTSGATAYTITHNLGGTVHVNVYNKTTGDTVITDVSRTDDNVVVISVNTALAVDHAVSCVYSGAAPA